MERRTTLPAVSRVPTTIQNSNSGDAVRVADVVVEAARVGAARDRAHTRPVAAGGCLVGVLLGVSEGLHAAGAGEPAGDDHGGDGVLQRAAPNGAEIAMGSRQDGHAPRTRSQQLPHAACPFLHCSYSTEVVAYWSELGGGILVNLRS